jgi:hypothetical protein
MKNRAANLHFTSLPGTRVTVRNVTRDAAPRWREEGGSMTKAHGAGGVVAIAVALVSALLVGVLAMPAQCEAQGTFEGTIGAGVVIGSARGPAGGRVAGARGTAATSEVIRVQIDHLTTPQEQAAIQAATTISALLDVTRSFRHGTVTIAGRSFPIPAAFRGAAGRYTLLIPSDAYGAAGVAGRAATAAIAVITLNPAGSQGSLFTTTQVVAWSDETGATARAGRSALREITGLRAS